MLVEIVEDCFELRILQVGHERILPAVTHRKVVVAVQRLAHPLAGSRASPALRVHLQLLVLERCRVVDFPSADFLSSSRDPHGRENVRSVRSRRSLPSEVVFSQRDFLRDRFSLRRRSASLRSCANCTQRVLVVLQPGSASDASRATHTLSERCAQLP